MDSENALPAASQPEPDERKPSQVSVPGAMPKVPEGLQTAAMDVLNMLPVGQPATDVPEGLQTLAALNQLMIQQAVDLLEVISFWECKNKYRITNTDKEQVYFAIEESSAFSRMCCGTNRGFVLHIQDNQKREVLSIVREFRCCTGCCWFADGCCQYPMIVNDSAGRKLGMVRQMKSWYRKRFGIFDEHDVLLYEMWAPWCPCQRVCCRGDIIIPICNIKDKSQIGDIRKIWSGIVQEGFTTADAFKVSFPMDLLVTHKALMLASVFLIDFTLFEDRDKKA
ncbi:hypothetical protein BsWGS_25479 [Bradybaena similaris]